MEEASSVIKAIEKGWIKAGQPKEFSVKIFEYPQKNFLGLTKRSAKIAILFDERKGTLEQEEKDKQQEIAKGKTGAVSQIPSRRQPRRSPEGTSARVREQKAPISKQPIIEKKAVEPREKVPAILVEWTPQMIEFVRTGITDTLSTLGRSSLPLKIEHDNAVLTVRIGGAILDDAIKQKAMVRALAQLILQMLRHAFRQSMRGYKLIVTTDYDEASR